MGGPRPKRTDITAIGLVHTNTHKQNKHYTRSLGTPCFAECFSHHSNNASAFIWCSNEEGIMHNNMSLSTEGGGPC